jgi:protein SCO1/2
MTRTVIAITAIVLTGILALGRLTHGFTVLTAEAARRQAVAAAPSAVPDLWGIDQTGKQRAFLDKVDRRTVIVDFIFTRCTSVCSALGASYQELQAEIQEKHLENEVRLVTVSFDPEHDTPAIVADYAGRFRADPQTWTILSPIDLEALRRTLEVFGVVKIAAPDGQFIHNAAFHIIDRHGRLARIVDIEQPRKALAVARQLFNVS